MRQFNELLCEQENLEGYLTELRKVQLKIAKLNIYKEELTGNVIAAFGHNHDGQKSYEYDIWKVEVKTPCVYSLDRSKYSSGDIKLPDQYNPIKESVSYTVDKKLCESFMEKAPKSIKMKLAELIEKRPGKASVSIKENQ